MQRGVFVCLLLLACHSRQDESSTSAIKDTRTQQPNTHHPASNEGAKNNTHLDSYRQNEPFSTLFTTNLPSINSPLYNLPPKNESPKENTTVTGGVVSSTISPTSISSLARAEPSPTLPSITTPFLPIMQSNNSNSSKKPPFLKSFSLDTSTAVSPVVTTKSPEVVTARSTVSNILDLSLFNSSDFLLKVKAPNRTRKTESAEMYKKLTSSRKIQTLNTVRPQKGTKSSRPNEVNLNFYSISTDIPRIKRVNVSKASLSYSEAHKNTIGPAAPPKTSGNDFSESNSLSDSGRSHGSDGHRKQKLKNVRLSLGEISELHPVASREMNLSQSTAKNSEVMSPPPSLSDVSKNTSPISLSVKDEEDRRKANAPNKSDKTLRPTGGSNVSESRSDRDDYYEYSEYTDFTVKHFNISGFREAAVIPDPDFGSNENRDPETETEPEIILPDDSLADTDLHDHDLIDSVMYIYFGGSPQNGRGAGRQVLIVGAVIGLVAQFLTLASAVQRIRIYPREETTVILLHTQLAFTGSNLVFMLGVQATSVAGQCARIAVSLHYLHLTAGVWLLINCAQVCLKTSIRLRHTVAAWGLPFIHVLCCYIFNRRIYETRNYCWMSIHRGLLLSFLAPAFMFLTLNTALAVIGHSRATRSKDNLNSNHSVEKKALRVAVVLLPAFVFDWFVEVVALENSSALVFPLLFVASKGFINWFIFACWLPSDQSWPDIEDEYDEDYDDYEEDMTPALLKLKYLSDEQYFKSIEDCKLSYASDHSPLLQEPIEIYKCGRREDCELQMDPISTICS